MKSFFLAALALVLTVSLVDANGAKGKVSGGTPKVVPSQGAPKIGNVGPKVIDKKVSDAVGKPQVVDKKIGDVGKPQVVDKKIGDVAKGTGKKFEKIEIQGNKNVAKLPGFKADPKVHQQFCAKYHLPGHLHNHCFFHHDFCWNHHCWFPSHGCCGYWHPHARCWYYWYEPYCCYLPYSYIETYAPVMAQQPAPMVVNVNNTATDTEIDPDAPPTLPPGAAATLPPGVNPIIPAPKQ